jgi:hypothetical protein
MDYVDLILENRVRVLCKNCVSLKERLPQYLDATVTAPYLELAYTDDQSLAIVLSILRDNQIAFVGINRAGWSPGEIFEDLRDKGLLSGTFIRVVWQDSATPIFEPA